MDESHKDRQYEKEDRFSKSIERDASRKERAGKNRFRMIWYGLGAVGMVGWSVAFPTLLGTALGWWLDKHRHGTHSWTLALLVAGLVVGCFIAWMWVSAEFKKIEKEEDRDA